MAHALVVEDDADSAVMMAALVARSGFTASTAGSLFEARRLLAQRRPDIVLLDLQLPDGDGLALLDDACLLADAPVVLMTGHGSVDSSVAALRRGAADYLVKPVDHGRLQQLLHRCLQPVAPAAPTAPAAQPTGVHRLVGQSAAMAGLRRSLLRVAPSRAPVLLSGETGTGKELAAAALHECSRRAGGPFLAVNCGALPAQLAESMLFGHERGSFTGAERPHPGLFEQAQRGTLFLDEVTELPLEVQVKLMRVLEDGSYMRLGSTRLQHSDARIVAATNRNPRAAVAEGRLLPDLYWRLAVVEIAMPPLRERRDDIALLAGHLLQAIGRTEGTHRRLSPAASQELAARDWPGNVRELRNLLYRAYLACDTGCIESADLSEALAWPAAGVVPVASAADSAAPRADAATGAPQPGRSLAQAERELVLATWEYCQGNRERTAAMLGISAKSLYNRLRAYRA